MVRVVLKIVERIWSKLKIKWLKRQGILGWYNQVTPTMYSNWLFCQVKAAKHTFFESALHLWLKHQWRLSPTQRNSVKGVHYTTYCILYSLTLILWTITVDINVIEDLKTLPCNRCTKSVPRRETWISSALIAALMAQQVA